MTDTKARLVDCAVELMLERGFAGTSVDQICCSAGVSKGAFFHHFRSKEEIAAAAADCFARCNEGMVGQAQAAGGDDPLAQLLCLLNVLEAVAQDPEKRKACLVGTLAQEVAGTSDTVQRSCCDAFDRWDDLVEGLVSAAKARHCPDAPFEPGDVAVMLSALLQGAMLLCKARGDDHVMVVAVRQFRAYVESLFATAAEGV